MNDKYHLPINLKKRVAERYFIILWRRLWIHGRVVHFKPDHQTLRLCATERWNMIGIHSNPDIVLCAETRMRSSHYFLPESNVSRAHHEEAHIQLASPKK